MSTSTVIIFLLNVIQLQAQQLYCGSNPISFNVSGGTCSSPLGIGGQNTSSGNDTYALTVSHWSNGGGGLYVNNTSNSASAKGIRIVISDGIGLYTDSNTGKGLMAVSTSGSALYGETATGKALYAKATAPAGWAGYFEGNVEVIGDLEITALTADVATTANLSAASFKSGTDRQLFVVPNLGTGGFNFLSQAGDFGVLFSDGLGSGGQNLNAGLVLGPWKGGHKGIRISHEGHVGIGITTPKADLDVDGDVYIEGTVGVGVSQPEATFHIEGDLMVKDPATGDNEIHLKEDGNIICRQLDVSLMPIPDFVFDKNYPLLSLQQFRTYIEANHHLPGIKSAKEYEQEGKIDVGELSVRLLEKVEELSLYILQLEEKIDNLEEQAANNSK